MSAGANGAQRLTYRIGPFNVIPGQNEISNEIIRQKPQVDGWITRIRPDLVYTSGRVPGVDVIHLHHGVWANLSRPNATTPGLPELFVAAGEEKTIMSFPKGYGYQYRASDTWLLNHMIHNLTPVPTQVYMVYEIDFIPRTSPRARGIRPVTPIWMDVQKGSAYPVFDVQKGSGRGGRYTYPDDEPNAYGGREARNEWVSDRDGVLVATGGPPASGRPVHRPLRQAPRARASGGRPAPARTRRAARRRCRAERAARARLQRPPVPLEGQVLRAGGSGVLGRGDDRHAARLEGQDPQGRHALDERHLQHQAGGLVGVDGDHGRLHGRGRPGQEPVPAARELPRPAHPRAPARERQPRRPAHRPARPAQAARRRHVPRVRSTSSTSSTRSATSACPARAACRRWCSRGTALTFRNVDNGRKIYHSLTSCKAPCNRSTGIAYPIADGTVQFESNTLGSAVPPATGALEWKTPAELDPGTYTYFCRIHPFMRGAFRVK